jgi:uncharacterized membrane protein YkvA (DUF1232 family)
MNFSLQSLYNWYRGLLQNPQYRWWVVLASVVYLVSPIDLAPDFLPVVGWLDDTVLIGMLVSELSVIATAKLKEKSTRVVDQSMASTAQVVDVSAVAVGQ